MTKKLQKQPISQKSVKPVVYSLDSQKISFDFLKSHLWGAADILRGSPEIIDYIIIHELCHIKIKGHSYNFWNLLRRYYLDYPKSVEWLNTNGKNLLS